MDGDGALRMMIRHSSDRFSLRRAHAIWTGWLLIGLLGGCDSSERAPAPVAAEAASPRQAMEAAVRRGDWKQAWTFSDAVLIAHGGDSKVLTMVSRVAHEVGESGTAADLLVEANQANEFSDPALAEQTAGVLLSTGKLFDAIDILSKTVAANPDHHPTRRFLFDLLVGTENRKESQVHGQYLVRHRKIDFELLLSLSNTAKRTQDITPLVEMVKLNPNDKRPLIGKAKEEYDRGQLTQSIETLQSILEKHPAFPAARILLGRALVDSGQFSELESWAVGNPDSLRKYAIYWEVIGDWSQALGKPDEAARAYWEATRFDPDVVTAWTKLGSVLRSLGTSENQVPATSLSSMQQRANGLSQVRELSLRFIKAGQSSSELATEMAECLSQLGRFWEAEAWAAMAMTLPADQPENVIAVRDSIVAKLRSDTPWQSQVDHAELQLQLVSLPLPDLNLLSQSNVSTAAISTTNSVVPTLRDEAVQRNLRFFGRTRDGLDRPGVRISESLGCGGGSIDFDLDGWTDLYLMNAGGAPLQEDSDPNALLRNLAGTFVEVTSASNTVDTGFGQGVAVGDVNQDGFPDMFLLNYGVNRLLLNQGDGTFSDVTPNILNRNGAEWSTSGAIADINGDGLPDLIAVNYCESKSPLVKLCDNAETGEARACSPLAFDAESDRFWQGTETGSFMAVDHSWGVDAQTPARGLGITVGALDDAPGLDVLIANDMSNNHYWSRSNHEPFQLVESGMLRGLACDDRSLAQGSMGIATGDFDRDGDLDVYVTNFEAEYNTYHEQQSAGVWHDRTVREGLATATIPMVGFGTEAVDFDNDGVVELITTNGHIDQFSLGDAKSEYYQPMQLFRRTSSGRFELANTLSQDGYLGQLHCGRGLWTLDANRDGRTDLVVTHQTEPTALLINTTDTKNHSASFVLVGRECERDAIGAIVELHHGDEQWTASLTAGDGYLCSNERVIRIGLGTCTEFSATVRWPDGSTQTHEGLKSDRQWLFVQDEPAFEF